MAQPSPVEMIYLYGVVVAFAAFIVTLFSVSIRTTLARPTAEPKAQSAGHRGFKPVAAE